MKHLPFVALLGVSLCVGVLAGLHPGSKNSLSPPDVEPPAAGPELASRTEEMQRAVAPRLDLSSDQEIRLFEGLAVPPRVRIDYGIPMANH